MTDGVDPISFLDTAVRIESHEDPSEMREFLVETLRENGVDPLVDDAGNTLATRGSGSRHVALNTHIDTVSPHVPYDRGDDEGVIRGRGSCDAKGPLAAILSAFLAVDPGDGGRLTLAVTPDEEVYSTGAAALDLSVLSGVSSPAADAYVVGEPTGLDVCTAAKGRFEGQVTLTGRNAHAAEPETGVNAVAAAENALAAIRGFDAERDSHPDLGPATLTPTVVEGGEATNQVPADCAITVDRRSVPPETATGFRGSLEAHLRAAAPASADVEVALTERPTPFLEAFATPADGELATTLADAAGGEVRPFTAATEASYFAADAPTVVFGPGVLADDEGAVAHAEREYVRRSEIERAADALRAALDRLV